MANDRQVVRGGTWHNLPFLARAASCHGHDPHDRSSVVGWRLACSSQKEDKKMRLLQSIQRYLDDDIKGRFIRTSGGIWLQEINAKIKYVPGGLSQRLEQAYTQYTRNANFSFPSYLEFEAGDDQ